MKTYRRPNPMTTNRRALHVGISTNTQSRASTMASVLAAAVVVCGRTQGTALCPATVEAAARVAAMAEPGVGPRTAAGDLAEPYLEAVNSPLLDDERQAPWTIHCWPAPKWRSAHQSPPVPWQQGRPPRLEGNPTWRAGRSRRDGAAQVEEGCPRALVRKACREVAVQAQEKAARRDWLEMEWGRWLKGGTRIADSQEPAGGARRETSRELGGLLVPGKEPEGTQAKEIWKPPRGSRKPRGQAGPSPEGKGATRGHSLATGTPWGQKRPPPCPPPAG